MNRFLQPSETKTVKADVWWRRFNRIVSFLKPKWVHDHWHAIWETEITVNSSEELRRDLAIRLNRIQTEVQRRENLP